MADGKQKPIIIIAQSRFCWSVAGACCGGNTGGVVLGKSWKIFVNIDVNEALKRFTTSLNI